MSAQYILYHVRNYFAGGQYISVIDTESSIVCCYYL